MTAAAPPHSRSRRGTLPDDTQSDTLHMHFLPDLRVGPQGDLLTSSVSVAPSPLLLEQCERTQLGHRTPGLLQARETFGAGHALNGVHPTGRANAESTVSIMQ